MFVRRSRFLNYVKHKRSDHHVEEESTKVDASHKLSMRSDPARLTWVSGTNVGPCQPSQRSPSSPVERRRVGGFDGRRHRELGLSLTYLPSGRSQSRNQRTEKCHPSRLWHWRWQIAGITTAAAIGIAAAVWALDGFNVGGPSPERAITVPAGLRHVPVPMEEGDGVDTTDTDREDDGSNDAGSLPVIASKRKKAPDPEPLSDLREIDRVLLASAARHSPFGSVIPALNEFPADFAAVPPLPLPVPVPLPLPLPLPDLYVESLSALLFSSGEEADISVTVKNRADSGSLLAGGLVQFYAGDPFAGGTKIGPDLVLDVPVGEAVTRHVSLGEIGGAKEVFVFVDANAAVDETNELNNVNRVRVSSDFTKP